MAGTLHLGIDVSMAENTCCFLLQNGTEVRRRLTVPNNLPGAKQLVEELLRLMEHHHLDRLLVGLEATNLYWWHLACFLNSSPQLAPFEPRVYAFNPRLIKGFKKALSDTPKSDINDAYVIAERLRFGRHPAPFMPNELYQPLQRLTRFRCHLMHQITREKNYFLSFLFLKFSEYQNLDPFSNTFGAASQAVLTDYLTVDEIVAAPLEELVQLLVQEGKDRFPAPEAVAAVVKKAAQDSYRPHPALNEPLNLILSTTLENIRTLSRQIKKLDKAIERELRKFPNPLISVPGLGPVLVAGIMAEIQDIHRFPDHPALAKFAGLFWRTSESGSFQAEETSLGKSGNAYLRYYLIEAANSVRMHNAEYACYYRTKYDESSKHKHKRALVLTARKLVRMVDAMLRHNQLYVPQPRDSAQEVNYRPMVKARPAKQHRYRQVESGSLAPCA
jgi:transposase